MTPDDARRAYREAIRQGRPDLAAEAGRAFAQTLTSMNALPAALAMTAADSAERCQAALAAPGDLMAWLRAAVATLRLNMIAEGLADPDCTELAGQRLAACRQAAAALPVMVRDIEQIAAALRDVEDAHARIDVLILRHRAKRADDSGRPGDGRRIREEARSAAPRGTYLETVLTIELDRMAEAQRQLDTLKLDDAEAMADLDRLAGRPQRARQILFEHPVPRDPSWISLSRRAAIAFDLGEHAEAGTSAGQAIEVFLTLQAGAAHDYYRTLATDHVAVAEMYHVAIRAQLARGDVHGAFALADYCRAGMIRDGAGESAARRAASARLAAVHERLAKAALTGTAPSHAAVVAEIMAAEDAVDSAARGEAPARRQPSGLAEIQRALPEDGALLLVQSFDRDLIIWVVRPGEVVVKSRTRPRRDLIRAVRELHATCADFDADPAVAETLAARLAADLIEPVAGALADVKRLYLVPPAHLMLLPFAVLPLDGVPLGRRCILSVLPAAALLTRDSGPARLDQNRPMLLVGDPAYAGLPRLPGTGAEVRAIAADRPTAVTLTRENATVAEFARLCSGRSIVHLATHGLVDERHPHLSELALAGHDRITLPDLAGLASGIDVLVLSACHTGRGRATAGGDVFGLARAALAAGVRHLIVSLWPVDDRSACELMTTMYDPGADVATALSRAAQQTRATNETGGAGRTRDLSPSDRATAGANPIAHWAPFIHIGV